ncbi:hypothetical protein GCM10009779_50320 [Polymorphospora rubra]
MRSPAFSPLWRLEEGTGDAPTLSGPAGSESPRPPRYVGSAPGVRDVGGYGVRWADRGRCRSAASRTGPARLRREMHERVTMDHLVAQLDHLAD